MNFITYLLRLSIIKNINEINFLLRNRLSTLFTYYFRPIFSHRRFNYAHFIIFIHSLHFTHEKLTFETMMDLILYTATNGEPSHTKNVFNGPQCSKTLHRIWDCSIMFDNNPRWSRTFQIIPEPSRTFQNVLKCFRMRQIVLDCSRSFQRTILPVLKFLKANPAFKKPGPSWWMGDSGLPHHITPLNGIHFWVSAARTLYTCIKYLDIDCL